MIELMIFSNLMRLLTKVKEFSFEVMIDASIHDLLSRGLKRQAMR